MQFLKLRTGADHYRNGLKRTTPLIVRKSRKYGIELDTEPLSRRRCILITGAHDSGKSRCLHRLWEAAPQVWRKPAILLSALEPLQAWVDNPDLAEWWDSVQPAPKQTWEQLKQHQRLKHMPRYFEETEAILMIDDAHKLNGRKLSVINLCVSKAGIWIITASDEERISPTLRAAVQRRNPQTVRFDSEASYDATAIALWIIAAVAVGLGAWQIAAVIAGLKVLAHGRRAARQD